MTSRDFCFWLQGFIEVSEPLTITGAQLDIVKKHLALVFKHEIDPSMGPQKTQDDLNKIHGAVIPDGVLMRC